MALRGTRQDEAQRRALLFGAHQRRPATPHLPAAGIARGQESETLEAANDAGVDGLRGRVGEMRHVRGLIGGLRAGGSVRRAYCLLTVCMVCICVCM